MPTTGVFLLPLGPDTQLFSGPLVGNQDSLARVRFVGAVCGKAQLDLEAKNGHFTRRIQ